MKSFGKVMLINLVVLLLYSLVIRIVSGHRGSANLEILIASAWAVAIHVIICLLVSVGFFGTGNREGGRTWLGVSGAVLLIGFSVCLGNAAW